LAVIFGAVAGLWQRVQRTIEAICYGGLAGLATVASLALITWFGFSHVEDGGATWIYALYAVAALAAARATGWPQLSWIGSALLLAAIIQGLVFRYAGSLELQHPWIAALTVHSVLAMVAGICIKRIATEARRTVSDPLGDSALLSSLAASPLVALACVNESAAHVLPYAWTITAVWLAGVWAKMQRGFFIGFQVLLTGAVLVSHTLR
jgi:hypothetical protein